MGFLYAAVLWKYQGLILFCLLVWFVYKLEIAQTIVSWWRARRARIAADKAEAALRAELENRQWLEAGLYEGRYPGATMPLTQQLYEPRDWYDYDDGLSEWK